MTSSPPQLPVDLLVVEGVVAYLRLLTGMLSAAGYRVRSAPNGAIARDAIAARVPDVLLLDADIGRRRDGLELCREVLVSVPAPGPLVIVMSDEASMDAEVAAFQSGAADFIVKPFEPERFLARLHAHIVRHRAAGRFARK